MPNYCSTSVVIFAESEHGEQELKSLHDLITELWNQKPPTAYLPLRRVLDACGAREDVCCRSDIYDVGDIGKTHGMTFFKLYCEDAWCPQTDALDALMESEACNDLKYCLRGEEAMCDVFVNTDDTGIFFPERYVLDYVINPKKPGESYKDDYVYFESLPDLLRECEKVFGVTAKNFDELCEKLWQYQEDHEDVCEQLSIHQFD